MDAAARRVAMTRGRRGVLPPVLWPSTCEISCENHLALRFLLVNQFYPPDMAPTGQHLHDVARCLVGRGHTVEVLCSRRSYEGGGAYAPSEVIDGVSVRRVSALAFGRRGAGRAADYLSFLLGVARRGAAEPRGYDVTLCLTTPPYVGWVVPTALGRRAGAVAQWVMDLYPDVLAAHGTLREGGRLYRGLRELARRQLSGSALVLTLGERARQRVAALAGERTRVEAVPLWNPFDGPPGQEEMAEWRRRRGWREGDVALLYSGNMGLGHRLGEFLEAAAAMADPSRADSIGRARDDGAGSAGRARDDGAESAGRARDDVVWADAGGGSRRGEVEAFVAAHPGVRVQALPYVSLEELPASLAAADVHLLSLRSPWQGLIVPSKLQAAFGLGRPAIFVGPRDCEPAEWIEESGGGWIVREGDVAGLVDAVAAAMSPAERARRGAAALAFARSRFSREANTARIAEMLEGVCAGPLRRSGER